MILSFMLLLSQLCSASDVWITTDRFMTPLEDKMLIEEYRGRFKDRLLFSAYQTLLREPVTSEQLKSIIIDDEQNHNLYLAGEFSKVQSELQKAMPGLLEIPAINGIDKIIFNRLLRTAELEDLLAEAPQEEFSPAWLAAAAWMARPADVDKRFSPTVVSKLKRAEARLKKVEVTVVAINSATVLIDGKKIDYQGEFFKSNIPLGTHQLSILIPGSQWFVQSIVITEAERYFQPQIKRLVGGNCDNPEYYGPFFTKGKKIIASFTSGCERVYDGKVWYSMEGRRLESLQTQAASLGMDLPEPKKSHGFFGNLVRSPWFWTGVGALVVGGIVYSQSQGTETVIQPTHN